LKQAPVIMLPGKRAKPASVSNASAPSIIDTVKRPDRDPVAQSFQSALNLPGCLTAPDWHLENQPDKDKMPSATSDRFFKPLAVAGNLSKDAVRARTTPSTSSLYARSQALEEASLDMASLDMAPLDMAALRL
jgi:hypothetical protein